MDSIRMNRLFSNNEKLSEKLLYELNNYKYFTESAVPNIAIICTEDTLKNNIAEVLDKTHNGYLAEVFSTAEETEELLKKIKNRDALIIYTTALKIAPKALYDLCSNPSTASKKVFVLLGGWNQLPRESTLVKRKLAQAAKELPHSDIVMVKGIYEGSSVEGLDSLSNTTNNILDIIKKNFKDYRYKQEETLYVAYKRQVNAELSSIQKHIVGTNEKAMELLNYIHKKQMGSQLVFKNVNIELVNAVDYLKNKFDGLAVGEFTDYLKENCSASELDNIGRVVEKLKGKMVEKTSQFIDELKDSPKVDPKVKIETFIQECINEMQFVVSELGQLNYVNSSLLSELSSLVQEVSSLRSIQDKIREELRESIENAEDKLKGRINSLQVDTKRFTFLNSTEKAVDGIETIREILEKISLEETKVGSSKPEKEEEKKKNEENYEWEEEQTFEVGDKIKPTTRLETKITEAKDSAIEDIVRQLIENAKVSVLAYMDSSMQTAKNNMENSSKYYVDQYFQKIIAVMNKISDDLAAQKKQLSPIV
jgi:hypothetical protein